MTATKVRNNSRVARLGWGMLLAISALLLLNGAFWFFFSPQRVSESLAEFGQVNPIIARQMATNARHEAILYLAFGLLALLVALEGFRHRSSWAWYAMWVQVALLGAIGTLYRDSFGVYLLGLVPVALVGQLLASKGLSSKVIETDEAPYDRTRP